MSKVSKIGNYIKHSLFTLLTVFCALYAQMDVKNSGGTILMRVTSDGYVGIGTTTPKAKLEVQPSRLTTQLPVWDNEVNVPKQHNIFAPNNVQNGVRQWAISSYVLKLDASQISNAGVQAHLYNSDPLVSGRAAIQGALATQIGEGSPKLYGAGGRMDAGTAYNLSAISGYFAASVFGEVVNNASNYNNVYAGYFVGAKSYFNGNVGINTTNPGYPLTVAGQAQISGGGPGPGKVLTSTDANGTAVWDNTSLAIPGDNKRLQTSCTMNTTQSFDVDLGIANVRFIHMMVANTSTDAAARLTVMKENSTDNILRGCGTAYYAPANNINLPFVPVTLVSGTTYRFWVRAWGGTAGTSVPFTYNIYAVSR